MPGNKVSTLIDRVIIQHTKQAVKLVSVITKAADGIISKNNMSCNKSTVLQNKKRSLVKKVTKLTGS